MTYDDYVLQQQERLEASRREKVAAGAALLDNNRPDWALRVNIEGLQMSSCNRCVLGWVFSDLVTKEEWEAYEEGEYILNSDGREVLPDPGYDYGIAMLFGDVRDWRLGHVPNDCGFGADEGLIPYWTEAIKERLDKGVDLL